MSKYLTGFAPFQSVVQSKKGLFSSAQSHSTAQSSIPKGKYFGQRLDPLDAGTLPNFVFELMEYLQNETNITKQGLFQRNGNKDQMNEVFDIINDPEEEDLELSEMVEGMEGNVYTVCDLIKEYFTMMPEPLLSFGLYNHWVACYSKREPEMLGKLRQIMKLVDAVTSQMMKKLFKFLNTIKRSAHINLMSSESLAIIFAPTILRPKEFEIKKFKDAEKICKLIQFMIDHEEEIF